MKMRVFVLVVVVAATWLQAGSDALSPQPRRLHMPVIVTMIPESVKAEHHAIHELLEEAMKAPGQVGTAARALGRVLHPHFVREEEIALPPLGALAPLASGTLPADTSSLLAMTNALKQELPQMLAEHTRIRSAVAGLQTAARAEHATKYERLAEQLASHAQMEEEVLYPAAVLVGDLIRARLANRSVL